MDTGLDMDRVKDTHVWGFKEYYFLLGREDLSILNNYGG